MASLAGSVWPSASPVVPCFSWASAASVFTKVSWSAMLLEARYHLCTAGCPKECSLLGCTSIGTAVQQTGVIKHLSCIKGTQWRAWDKRQLWYFGFWKVWKIQLWRSNEMDENSFRLLDALKALFYTLWPQTDRLCYSQAWQICTKRISGRCEDHLAG